MSLETTTNIAGLQSSAPSASDPVNQGDDHIRMIKAVLKNIFPGIGGQGLASPLLATETEFNYLTGLTSNIQAQINSLKTQFNAPTGTKMPFYQSSPPTGWTAATVQNDSMMRVVSSGGSGGTSGAGSGHSPILNNIVPSHTHTYSGNATSSGAHQHSSGSGVNNNKFSIYGATAADVPGLATRYLDGIDFVPSFQSLTSTDGAHTHSYSGTTAANAGATNWQPRYMDFCIGQKS